MEVSDWRNERDPLPIAGAPIARRPRIPARLLGIIGTILLHGFVVQTLVLGTSTRRVHVPLPQGLGSSASAAGAESELTLVVVQPLETKTQDSLFEEFVSRGSLLRDMPITLISPDPTPALNPREDQLTDNKDAESPVNSGDPEGQARLFGIYSGQIQARIERAWRRPRTPVNIDSTRLRGAAGEETFQCQVQIIQDYQGNVKEILLPQCNGSTAWQRSLVIAIQQASPLPAPPSPTVFTNALPMTFTGFGYRPDSSADDYEIEPRRMHAKNGLDVGSPQAPPVNPAVIAQHPSMHPLRAPTGEVQGTSIKP
jgi:hypothetical protein